MFYTVFNTSVYLTLCWVFCCDKVPDKSNLKKEFNLDYGLRVQSIKAGKTWQ